MNSMESGQIVKKFLEAGYQLDKKVLEFFQKNPETVDKILAKLKNINFYTPVLTYNILEGLIEKEELKVEIVKRSEEKKQFTAKDCLNYFISRYEKIRKILEEKVDLVNLISINKIPERIKNFSLIVLVREKNGNYIIAEDLTGSSKIFFENIPEYDLVVPDDVIGIVCEKNGAIYAKKIIWPDIPLRKEISKTKDEIFCLFISDLHMDSGEFKKENLEKFFEYIKKFDEKKLIIFILGDISSNGEDIEKFVAQLPNCKKYFIKGEIDGNMKNYVEVLEDPSIIKIADTVLFLTHGSVFDNYKKIWGMNAENVLLNLLKKRHLNPNFDFSKKIYDEDPYFLDIIPDILVSGHLHEPGIINYKGTTIIVNGSFITKPIFWLINLQTRESIKIDLT